MTSQTIYQCTGECFSVFDKYLSSSSVHNRDLAEQLRGRLALWDKYSGARAIPGYRLDDRLKGFESLTSAISALLRVIVANVTSSLPPGEGCEEGTSGSSKPQDTDRGTIHGLSIKQTFEAIGDHSWAEVALSIKELLSLTRAIRESSFASRDASVPSHYQPPDTDVFQRTCQVLVRRRFPDARTTLTEQLSKAITVRRNRLLYRRAHEAKLRAALNDSNTDPTEHRHLGESSVQSALAHGADRDSIPERPPSLLPTPGLGKPVPTVLSRPRQSLAFRVKEPKITQSSIFGRSTNVDEHTQDMYPPRPSADSKDPSHGTCPYCFSPLEFPLAESEWRAHVDRDLQVYVCISELCDEPVKFFDTSNAWLSHMLDKHGSNWPSIVHLGMWFCDQDHPEDPVAPVFSNVTAFETHLVDSHNIRGKKLDVMKRRKRKRGDPREVGVCPFCESSPKPSVGSFGNLSLNEHIATHLRGLALIALPGLPDNAPDTADSMVSSISVDTDSSRSMSMGGRYLGPWSDGSRATFNRSDELERLPPIHIDTSSISHGADRFSEIRKLSPTEAWSLYHFETHARSCKDCYNPREVVAEGQQLCRQGYELATDVSEHCYQSGESIYSTHRDDDHKLVRVEIPAEYDHSSQLLECMEHALGTIPVARYDRSLDVPDLDEANARLLATLLLGRPESRTEHDTRLIAVFANAGPTNCLFVSPSVLVEEALPLLKLCHQALDVMKHLHFLKNTTSCRQDLLELVAVLQRDWWQMYTRAVADPDLTPAILRDNKLRTGYTQALEQLTTALRVERDTLRQTQVQARNWDGAFLSLTDTIDPQWLVAGLASLLSLKNQMSHKPEVPDSLSYMVGWLAALPFELAAAIAMLDERHGSPADFHKSPRDDNQYTWGRMGKHNVVIASFPAGEYGTNVAAVIARSMLASLTWIRIGLLVGIGAGVPTDEFDIRLGDVVVSIPKGTSPGIVQYDLAKAKEGTIRPIGYLDKPPTALRAAVAKLQAVADLEDSKIPEFLAAMLKQYPKMAKTSPSKPGYVHQGFEQDIFYHDGKIVKRDPRDTLDPEVHYGVIASGNVLVKDSKERDSILQRLEAPDQVICFETEAAGLMNNFPCLVVRGICDYADEYKNDRWQKYAAATAAAYAKELLSYVDAAEAQHTAEIEEILGSIGE